MHTTHTRTHTILREMQHTATLSLFSNCAFQFHESSFDEWKERYQNILAGEEERDLEEEEDPMET